jgi:hypothetical protein
MRCRACGTLNAIGTRYCCQCGGWLGTAANPLTVASSAALDWPDARTTIARGLVALVLGTALELLRRRLARRSLADTQLAVAPASANRAVASPAVQLVADLIDRPRPGATEQVTEIFYYRQVSRRVEGRTRRK